MIPESRGFNSLNKVILEACAAYKYESAYTCMGRTLSYEELELYSRQLAKFFTQNLQLLPGDRVVIQLPNILQYPVAAAACFRAGLVIVNTNPLYSAKELKHQLQDSEAKLLIVLANTASSAAKILHHTSVEHVIVTELGDLHGPIKGRLLNFVVKYLKRLVPEYSFSSEHSFKKALLKGDAHSDSVFTANESPDLKTLAVLQYTGGTTGVSKAAMLSHGNLLANIQQINERFEKELNATGAVMIAPLPLYHIYGFTLNFLLAVDKGAHTVLVPNPKDIPGFIKLLKKISFDGFAGINTLYNALLNNDEFHKLDFSRLRLSSSGGMALSSDIADRWLKLTGCQIFEGYGLTEASPCVSCNNSEIYRKGTIGLPVRDTELKVIDEEGKELPRGNEGELCVRGPQVMSGYWKQEAETAKVLDKDGWLRTGDIAIIQEDGYLQIIDRLKDMINVSGFNVYPNEIEDFVCSHPKVNEAVVIGLNVNDIEEVVKLIVVKTDLTLDEDELRAYCREGLAPYKVPKVIEFRDHLPKSNVGKVLRRMLRDEPEI